MFERRGLVKVSVKEEALVDTIIERGIEGGAEDFDQDVREGVIEIQVSCHNSFHSIKMHRRHDYSALFSLNVHQLG